MSDNKLYCNSESVWYHRHTKAEKRSSVHIANSGRPLFSVAQSKEQTAEECHMGLTMVRFTVCEVTLSF
jgi:hypothetical protein